jgi:hypothetical protein
VKPELRQHVVQLQSGIGMKGGPDNPLARSGNKDTQYRIHGTHEPWTTGTNVSSGCVRLTNEDLSIFHTVRRSARKSSCSGLGNPGIKMIIGEWLALQTREIVACEERVGVADLSRGTSA